MFTDTHTHTHTHTHTRSGRGAPTAVDARMDHLYLHHEGHKSSSFITLTSLVNSHSCHSPPETQRSQNRNWNHSKRFKFAPARLIYWHRTWKSIRFLRILRIICEVNLNFWVPHKPRNAPIIKDDMHSCEIWFISAHEVRVRIRGSQIGTKNRSVFSSSSIPPATPCIPDRRAYHSDAPTGERGAEAATSSCCCCWSIWSICSTDTERSPSTPLSRRMCVSISMRLGDGRIS